MKKLMLLCLLVVSAVQMNAQKNNENTIFIFSTGLDKDKMPVDNIKESKIGRENLVYMFLTNIDDSPLQADSIHFKLYMWNQTLGKYFKDNVFSINIENNWTWCYKAIYFNLKGTFKVDVYADERFLTSSTITSVDNGIS